MIPTLIFLGIAVMFLITTVDLFKNTISLIITVLGMLMGFWVDVDTNELNWGADVLVISWSAVGVLYLLFQYYVVY